MVAVVADMLRVGRVMARGPSGALAGSLAGFDRLQFRDALNGPGGWMITVSSDHPAVDAVTVPGAGIIVYDTADRVIYSGPVLPAGDEAASIRSVTPTATTITVQGVSDLTCLFWRAIVPPGGKTHETVSGVFGAAAAEMVRRQIRLPGWGAADTDIGEPVTLSGRYTNLGEVVCGEASAQNVAAIARWSSGQTRFSVAEIVETATPISVDAATAIRVTRTRTPDEITFVRALGQGVGTARTVKVADGTGGDQWRQLEETLDRRDLDTPGAVQAAADAALLRFGETVAVELTPGVPVPMVGESASVSTDDASQTMNVAESTTTVEPGSERTVVTFGAPARTVLQQLSQSPAAPIFD